MGFGREWIDGMGKRKWKARGMKGNIKEWREGEKELLALL